MSGGSKSSSSSNTSTTSQDNRQSVSGGTGVSTPGNNNTITVNTLDDGAITAAFGTANNALNDVVQEGTSAMDANQQVTSAALANSQSIASSAINAVQTSSNDYAQLLDSAMTQNSQQLAAAYQDANTSDMRTVIVGAMCIAALAIYMATRGRG